MSNYQIIHTLPGEKQCDLFDRLPHRLYAAGSPRFQLGNDPVATHLTTCCVLLQDGQPIGRFAFYENPDLEYEGQAAACMGSYECIADTQASSKLLAEAQKLAAQKGYAWLIGPMEGSTINNYRFSQHNDTPNFFLEPYHHIYYNAQFQLAGFHSIADYFSNKDESLQTDLKEVQQLEQHFLEQGAVFRNLDTQNMEEDLHKIAVFCKKAFAQNFLYTPIGADDFVQKYAKLGPYFDPELIWLVEDANGAMQAFLFAIKNHTDASQKSLIIKSMARKKNSSFRGIGNFLSAKTTYWAKSQGYSEVIHAFVFQDNYSRQISERFTGAAYKAYALYGLNINQSV